MPGVRHASASGREPNGFDGPGDGHSRTVRSRSRIRGGDVAGTGLGPRGIRACRAREDWPQIAPSGATWLRPPCPGAIRNPIGMRVDIRTCCAGDESVLRRALNGDRHLEAKLARPEALFRSAGSAGERSVVGAWKVPRSGSHGQASRKRSRPRSGDQGEIRSPDRRWPCPGRSGLPTADQGLRLNERGIRPVLRIIPVHRGVMPARSGGAMAMS